MKYYKLTDQKAETNKHTHWDVGTTHKAEGTGKNLCSRDVIHLYDHPLKAVLFNPIHANFDSPRLWRVKARQIVANDGLKVGAKIVTTIAEIPVPIITINQKVRFAIYCALAVYTEPSFRQWAEGWLSGKDRTKDAAEDARDVAATAWGATTARDARDAAAAAWDAAASAWGAVAAAATRDAATAWSAAGAARDAAATAWGVAGAAAWGAAAWGAAVDFVLLAKKAIKEEKDGH